MIITIDGPTASGKSSIARILARDFSMYYLYSGLLYRALGYLLVRDYQYSKLMLSSPCLEDVKSILHAPDFVYSYQPSDGVHISMKEEVITPLLKTVEVDLFSSLISVHEAVRDEILAVQRTISKQHDLIADGRDCGTVVFPEAQYKFFLTADPEVRAVRWQRDQLRLGKEISLEAALNAVSARDNRDTQRSYSPLVAASNAYIIDNSNLNLQQTVELFKIYLHQNSCYAQRQTENYYSE